MLRTLFSARGQSSRLISTRFASTSAGITQVVETSIINGEPTSSTEADTSLESILNSKPSERKKDQEAASLRWGSESNAATPYSRTPLHLPLSPFLKHTPGTPRPSTLVVALAPSVFAHHIRRDILHACVVHHLDGLRQGTASTKTRGDVKASGRKLRPQKGSGRARLGDAASPMLRGGGVAFGPKPRDFSTKLPRKVREMGMRVVLSAKLRERMLNVVQRLDWEDGKANSLAKRLMTAKWADKTLFVIGGEEIPTGLERASGNIPGVEVVRASELTVYEALRWKRLVLDVDAIGYFAERLGKEGDALEDISSMITYPTTSAAVTVQ